MPDRNRGKAVPKKAQILIVDDHPMVRRGLKEAISMVPDLEICAEAGDKATARQMLAAVGPDLAIIDLSLGRESGMDLIWEIRSHQPKVKILVLSMHDDSLYAERVLRAGAHGYVNKSQPVEVLVEAIHKVLTGETALSPLVTEQLVKRAVSTQRAPRVGVEGLSNRELQVFELMGRGLTVREIADQLCVSVKTVESHREHVKVKLNVEKNTELLRRATIWLEGRGDG